MTTQIEAPRTNSTRSSQRRAKRAKRPTQGGLVADFIETFCRLTKGEQAGQLIKLRPWQREILNDIFELRADGKRKHRRGLLGMPRKQGKSLLAAGIALYGLVVDEVGADVFVVAGDRAQARIIFRECARMVELDPVLSQRLRVTRDLIEAPATGSILRVLSADASRAEGLNPSMVLFDEVHVQPDDRLWSTMNLGSGTRSQPLVLGITTAGARFDGRGQDSLCYRLWQYGKRVEKGEVDDSTFYFRWFSAPDDADYRDPKTWALANPALGDFLSLDDMESAVKSLPEAEVRTRLLNQWVTTHTAWLPNGAWEKLNTERQLQQGEQVVLAFDGAFTQDCSAIVAATLDGHIELLKIWERPLDDPHYQVPIDEVEASMRELCATYQVIEIAADPFRWARTLQAWEAEGLPVVVYPQSPSRLVPACASFLEAVTSGTITHTGDATMARHLANCTVKVDRLGPRIVKEHKGSPRKIDAAVCAVMAYDRARYYATAGTKAEATVEWI